MTPEKGFGFVVVLMAVWLLGILGIGGMLVYVLGKWLGVF